MTNFCRPNATHHLLPGVSLNFGTNDFVQFNKYSSRLDNLFYACINLENHSGILGGLRDILNDNLLVLLMKTSFFNF